MFRVSGASKEATPESLFFIRPPRPSPESGLPSTVNLLKKNKKKATKDTPEWYPFSWAWGQGSSTQSKPKPPQESQSPHKSKWKGGGSATYQCSAVAKSSGPRFKFRHHNLIAV